MAHLSMIFWKKYQIQTYSSNWVAKTPRLLSKISRICRRPRREKACSVVPGVPLRGPRSSPSKICWKCSPNHRLKTRRMKREFRGNKSKYLKDPADLRVLWGKMLLYRSVWYQKAVRQHLSTSKTELITGTLLWIQKLFRSRSIKNYEKQSHLKGSVTTAATLKLAVRSVVADSPTSSY